MGEKLRYGIFTEQKAKAVIPHGCYCYDENGTCPFWDRWDHLPEQSNGYCHWMQCGDWEEDGTMLLWDQCKECGINTEEVVE